VSSFVAALGHQHKAPYAHRGPHILALVDIVRFLRPTALVGVSAQPGAFTEEIVRLMCANNPRPILFPLSNPTSRAECTAEQALGWSGGTALFASGSPFPPVTVDGREYVPGQCNNAYIFPGVGLGVVVSRARHVTDDMFRVAARTLADLVTGEDAGRGSLFPAVEGIRRVSAAIGVAIAKVRPGPEGSARAALPSSRFADHQRLRYQHLCWFDRLLLSSDSGLSQLL
jgi:malate dehydrogenase (oxaloacetate-decarboxylating)(NADP+)